MPRSAAISAQRFSRSGGGTNSTSAPSARVAAILTGDDTSGITITHGIPKARAVNASACAWFPDECATTPLARTSAGINATVW